MDLRHVENRNRVAHAYLEVHGDHGGRRSLRFRRRQRAAFALLNAMEQGIADGG